MSFKAIGRQMGYHYTVVSRPVRKHTNQQCERFAKIRQTTGNSPDDFRRFLTVLVDRRLLGSQCCLNTGMVANGIRLTPKEHPAHCPLRWRLSNGLGCISHYCKLDLVTIQGNLTGDQYIRDVLQPVVVPHFDNHLLATRPVYIDSCCHPRYNAASN
jgi:hypothetical protein